MAFINFSIETERIRNLQETLRRLGMLTNTPEFMVGVDGNFDNATRSAVADFQRMHELSPTGIPDNDTWRELRQALRTAERTQGAVRPISIFQVGRTVGMGERSELVHIIQLLLREIDLHHDFTGQVPVSGAFDMSTENVVKEFQKNTGLPITGIVDLPTWNRIALEFENISQ